MKIKTFLKGLAGIMMSGIMIAGASSPVMNGTDITQISVSAVDTSMRDITTMELVRDMGIGINLGNTFDACGDWIAEWSDGNVEDYEKAWGSPVITREMIQGYADEGFGVLRIPTAWSNMMVQDGNYKINEQWMARITEIVDWTLDSGMYAIVNIHWDNGWVNTFPDNKDECMRRFETMWTQISDNFKDYGDHLMFEAQNEEFGWDSVWNKWAGDNGKAESYALVNEINQKFVDTIRKSGGNNPQRHLLISGYNTGIDVTCDPMFKMPYDPANRMAVSVHYYSPAGFAILEEDADWGKAIPTWGTDEDFRNLYNDLDMMKTTFADKGIPVIIGEYGCPSKNKDPESVRLFLTSVCEAAYTRQLCPIMWDTPGGRYDREGTHQLVDRQLHDNFIKIVGEKPKPEPTTEAHTETPTEAPTEAPTEVITEAPTNVTSMPVEVLIGDTDFDGKITAFDMVIARKVVIGEITDIPTFEAADVDQNGNAEMNDLVLLSNYLLGKINNFSNN